MGSVLIDFAIDRTTAGGRRGNQGQPTRRHGPRVAGTSRKSTTRETVRDSVSGRLHPDVTRALLFDLDDTLCEYARSGEAVLSIAFERAGVDPFFDYDAYVATFDDYRGEAETLPELREACFAALARERGRDPDRARVVARAYTDERDPTDVRPLPGARAAVAHDGPVGLVTNGPPDVQRPKLRALDLVDAFDAVVYAGHDVPAKPAVGPFERALSDLGVEPAETAHVGNSLRTDVAGANAAGVTSVWVDDDSREPLARDDPAPDHRVASLEAFPPW